MSGRTSHSQRKTKLPGLRAWVSGAILAVCAPAFAQEAKVASAGCALALPTFSQLGYASPPPVLSKAQQKALQDVDRSLRKGDLAQAKKGLEPLAREVAENVEVRFRSASLHASLGELDSTCSEVAALACRDFFAVAKRLESERALAKLRFGDDGARLREHLKAIEGLWRQAAASGLPAMMSQGRRGEMGIWQSQVMRGGVYLHEVGRFLPLEPGVDGAAAALVNPKAGTTAVVKETVSACKTDGCPRITAAQVEVFALDDWRRPHKHWSYGGYGDEAATMEALDIRSLSGTTAVRVHDCCCYNGCTSPWTTIGPALKAGLASSFDKLEMTVDFRGTLLGMSPPGVHVRKGQLVSEGAADVRLPKEHADSAAIHDILIDKPSKRQLVCSTIDRCECSGKKEGPILRYAVSTVDPSTGKATLVLEGEGAAAAMLDGKGAIYIQTGDTVRRWSSIAAVGHETGASIPPGFVLVVPRSPRGNCCGL